MACLGNLGESSQIYLRKSHFFFLNLFAFMHVIDKRSTISSCARLKPYKAVVCSYEENGRIVLQGNFVGDTNDFVLQINSYEVCFRKSFFVIINKLFVMQTEPFLLRTKLLCNTQCCHFLCICFVKFQNRVVPQRMARSLLLG